MFSGIVQETGKVIGFVKEKDIYNLSIECSSEFISDLKKGASISVDGVCLTVKDENPEILRFDLVEETIKRTNFQNIKTGDNVNIERSLKMGDEIGGHPVSGHIHGISKVISIDKRDQSWDVKFSVEPFMHDYMLHKGYVAINGCSLTVGEVSNESFMIHLIPETLSITNLFQLEQDSIVNVELDQNTIIIADTVKKYLDGKS
ncbi:MAG: riboflavin synthase subunit alpha [Gammaproteobacteria bacterium]